MKQAKGNGINGMVRWFVRLCRLLQPAGLVWFKFETSSLKIWEKHYLYN